MNPLRIAALLLLPALLTPQSGGDLLYNGIRLPKPWPPSVQLSSEPQPDPPYLTRPPAVIPIDTGRQLFVDHFLIEETDLRRVFHQPEYYAKNPVLKPDQRWELNRSSGLAMPFSDGVFFDPATNLFKLWYRTEAGTSYATSRDGVHWQKPILDVRAGTNIVIAGVRDSATVWLDLEETDPARRYKFINSGGHLKPLFLRYSADGIHWTEPVAQSLPAGDRTTFFYNPFRKVWVLSLREHDWTPHATPDNPEHVGRLRAYHENADLAEAVRFAKDDPKLWVGADRLD
ncbi:MAG: hypothetical protein ABIZ80_06060, partial [Bryobacteraceae bacterium]